MLLIQSWSFTPTINSASGDIQYPISNITMAVVSPMTVEIGFFNEMYIYRKFEAAYSKQSIK